MAVNATPPSGDDWEAWAARQRDAYLVLEAAHHDAIRECSRALDALEAVVAVLERHERETTDALRQARGVLGMVSDA